MATAAIGPLAIGNTTWSSMRTSPQPSTRAASSISCGNERKNAVSRRIANGRAVATYGMTRPW